MSAAVLTEPGRIVTENRPVPTPRSGDVLVRVSAVGVCGSDTHYYREGRIGDFVVSSPLVLGHEASGVIVAVGEGVSENRIGSRVSVEPQRPDPDSRETRSGHYNLCPHMEFYATPPVDGALCEYVSIGSTFAHDVPDSVSDNAAALFEPLSVAIATARKAGITGGSRVLIAGAGPVGLLTAQVSRAFGATDIIVSDISPSRRESAARYGATRVLDPTSESVHDLDVDAFVDASGAPRAVQDGMRAVRPAGRVVLVGMGGDEYPIPVSVIQNRELWVTGVFRYADTWPTALELAQTGRVDLDSMVTAHFDLAHVEDALNHDRTDGSIKAVVTVTPSQETLS
jgi:L-iditol 2-dehydrogenase